MHPTTMVVFVVCDHCMRVTGLRNRLHVTNASQALDHGNSGKEGRLLLQRFDDQVAEFELRRLVIGIEHQHADIA